MYVLEGKILNGYRFVEKIGDGGFGEVWLAERRIGDKLSQVAIKVVRPTYRGEDKDLKPLEEVTREAQILASLQHPRIVPLFDYQYNADHDLVLMVMPLLKGSLEKYLSKNERLPIETALRWIDQIIEGLAYLHAKKNYVHRDLKPGNILIDSENNILLSDFGLTQDLVGSKKLDTSGGTARYASPEQWDNPFADYRADIYALAIIIYELIAGRYPFHNPMIHFHADELPSLHVEFPDIPPQVDQVLAKAKAIIASERYTSVGDLGRALREAIFGIPDDSPLDVSNPYQGLWAFSEHESSHFFGRNSLINRLIERLSQSGEAGRFCAVVGASGSGKSSVVRAGLIPALSRGNISGSQHWRIAHMIPGDRPLIKLEAALLHAHGTSGSLIEQLQGKEGLQRALEWLLPEDSRVEQILFCDQFEELFTQTIDEQEHDHFLDILVDAVTAPHSRLRLIVALRADFYDRPLQHPDLGELLRKYTEAVLPMSQSELREAITKPAESVGARWEQGLVETIIAHIEGQPGGLPLLQFTLNQIFERDSLHGRVLTRATYDALGGVVGALSQTADEIYSSLDETDNVGKQTAKQVFLRLVNLGEGTQDTRRRASLEEVVNVSPEAQRIIDVYTMNRLLITDRNPSTRLTTVEIAHEALIRNWSRLQDWLDYNRSEIPLQRLLSHLTQEWQMNQDADLLARGQRLDDLIGFVRQTELALTDTERNFVKQSQKQREYEIKLEKQRIEREHALIEERKQASLRADSSRRWLRQATAIFSIVFAVSLAGLMLSITQRFQLQADADAFALDQKYRTKLGQGGVFVDGALSERVIASMNELANWQAQSQLDDKGVEMVLVPAGCFYMGSVVSADTQPIQGQCLDKSFWIDRYEVTNEQYMQITGEIAPSGGQSRDEATFDYQPVNNIDWKDARDFCRTRGGRLPRELEWEYAARGSESRAYPSGFSFNPDEVVFASNSASQQYPSGSPRRVKDENGNPQRPEGTTWVGAYDMAGNVSEWTSTLYDQTAYPYPYVNDGREQASESPPRDRVIRGGAYNSSSEQLRSDLRNVFMSNTAQSTIGFRCVRDVQ